MRNNFFFLLILLLVSCTPKVLKMGFNPDRISFTDSSYVHSYNYQINPMPSINYGMIEGKGNVLAKSNYCEDSVIVIDTPNRVYLTNTYNAADTSSINWFDYSNRNTKWQIYSDTLVNWREETKYIDSFNDQIPFKVDWYSGAPLTVFYERNPPINYDYAAFDIDNVINKATRLNPAVQITETSGLYFDENSKLLFIIEKVDTGANAYWRRKYVGKAR